MVLKSKQALFLLQILRVQFLAVFTRQKELALQGQDRKTEHLWDLGADWPQTVVQAWPLLSFLRKGVKDRRRTALLSRGSGDCPGSMWNIFKHRTHRVVSCFSIHGAGLHIQREEGGECLFSLCSALCYGGDWWEDGCMPLGWGK